MPFLLTLVQFAQDFRIQATCSTPNAGTKLVIFALTILPRQGETGSSAQVIANQRLLLRG